MSTTTFHGSCHCGRVRLEADIDLAKGTSKCNCSICWKTRNWSVLLKPDAFRLLAGADDLSDYTFGSGQGHHVFCRHCGVRTHGFGDVPEIGGAFVSVKMACLDDLDPALLAGAPVTLCDGRNNAWWNPPSEARHL
jgi:hypothetical protein